MVDGTRFDRLARELAAGASRRRFLAGLAGVAVAARAAGRSVDAATCRGSGRRCSQSADCCSGLCDTTNSDPVKRNTCACLSLNTACSATAQCCDQGTGAVCAFESECSGPDFINPAGVQCCFPAGVGCQNSCQCCGTLFCAQGICG